MMRASRTPEIMADAAYVIFTKPSREFTGNFCIDDKVLYDERRARLRALSRRSVGAADVGFLRARRRRAAARRHRAAAALGWRRRRSRARNRASPSERLREKRVGWRAWTVAGALALTGAASAAGIGFRPDRAIRVATGVVAHNVCSKIFVSGLDPQTVFAETTERAGIRRLRRVLKFHVRSHRQGPSTRRLAGTVRQPRRLS